MSAAGNLRYLEHLLEAIEKIEASTAAGRSAFEADPDAFDAALRRLQTVAESTQRLSTAIKDRHPEVPWAAIAGFRNRIVHAYMDVDPDLVWQVIDHELQGLKTMARKELDRLS